MKSSALSKHAIAWGQPLLAIALLFLGTSQLKADDAQLASDAAALGRKVLSVAQENHRPEFPIFDAMTMALGVDLFRGYVLDASQGNVTELIAVHQENDQIMMIFSQIDRTDSGRNISAILVSPTDTPFIRKAIFLVNNADTPLADDVARTELAKRIHFWQVEVSKPIGKKDSSLKAP